MELREFAENILSTSSLDAKLAPPPEGWEISDLHPGPARPAPAVPGRPRNLRFKDSDSAPSRFPGLHQLDQTHERGRLLHFFANHELLAVELMALVLLRFPDAPPAFRRGVLQTLRDEQEHTRLYLLRMRACGIEFGDLPVSGFFWRAVSRMESPLDFVAGLSLTFEQANLDFARHFADGFRTVGDAESAALLDRIYHDEIAHVAHGLKWFRRWKSPGLSDWDAFCRHLRLPLSPRRAKGFSVNVEGRLAAGFDPEFVAHLEVYSQSKGRTPTVRLFNPFAEGHIASGPAFQPVRHQAALARDLAHLPMFLGHPDDVVLAPDRPRLEFLASLHRAGLGVPEFVAWNEPGTLEALARRKLGDLRPWAWSPDSVERLTPLARAVTDPAFSISHRYTPAIADLYSKAWSAAFLRDFLAALDDEASRSPGSRPPWPWMCSPDIVGVAVTSPDAALDAVARIRSSGHHRVVIKESLGLAGSNAIRLWEPGILATQRQWIENRLRKGHPLVVEPWLERTFDFSLQLERRPIGLVLLGYTTLLTDARGQFLGNAAAPDFAIRPPAQVGALLRDPGHGVDLPFELRQGFDRLVSMLETRLATIGYVGPVGIDAFVYRQPDGNCRLKPVVEINPRHTMGRVVVELMRHLQSGSHARFRLLNRSHIEAEGFADFPAFAEDLARREPAVLEGEPVPRLRQGAVCLSDPATTESCLAVLQVTRTPIHSPANPPASQRTG
ncbi:MAG: ferritin-like domain-containing protein [Limisphaerales bacterium]